MARSRSVVCPAKPNILSFKLELAVSIGGQITAFQSLAHLGSMSFDPMFPMPGHKSNAALDGKCFWWYQMPQARWLPTDAAELIVQIRSWPTTHTPDQMGVAQAQKRIRLACGSNRSHVWQEGQGDSPACNARRKSKFCRIHPPQEIGHGIPNQDPIPIVGHRGNNLSQVLIGLCGPATSWDSRWLHAVMQVLQESNWTWGDIGEFMFESMEGSVEYQPRYKTNIGAGNAKIATSLRLAQYCSCDACVRLKQQHIQSQQLPELFRCLTNTPNLSN